MLDNPIWSALTTDHADLALGGGSARRYPAEIGPLSGMPEQSDAGYAELGTLGGTAALFLTEAPRPPAGWTLLREEPIYQMVASREWVDDGTEAGAIRRLTAADAAAMVELAEVTEPGPFRLRTMELGNFYGVVEGGRLLAMAGKRIHLPGYIEVSGVCTHPEARGRGYAQRLMIRLMQEIALAGRMPFLHVAARNTGALRVYEKLDFRLRRSFELAVVRRAE
jgi:predicted GNAT family acetyltransferase